MSSTRFQTQFNRHDCPGEFFTEPSMMVPGMAFSVYDILRSQTPPSVVRSLEYNADNDDSEPLPVNIDLTDIAENSMSVMEKRQELNRLKAEFDNKQRKKAVEGGQVAQPTQTAGAPTAAAAVEGAG